MRLGLHDDRTSERPNEKTTFGSFYLKPLSVPYPSQSQCTLKYSSLSLAERVVFLSLCAVGRPVRRILKRGFDNFFGKLLIMRCNLKYACTVKWQRNHAFRLPGPAPALLKWSGARVVAREARCSRACPPQKMFEF